MAWRGIQIILRVTPDRDKTNLELRERLLSVLAWNTWVWVRVSHPGIPLIAAELREYLGKNI